MRDQRHSACATPRPGDRPLLLSRAGRAGRAVCDCVRSVHPPPSRHPLHASAEGDTRDGRGVARRICARGSGNARAHRREGQGEWLACRSRECREHQVREGGLPKTEAICDRAVDVTCGSRQSYVQLLYIPYTERLHSHTDQLTEPKTRTKTRQTRGSHCRVPAPHAGSEGGTSDGQISAAAETS